MSNEPGRAKDVDGGAGAAMLTTFVATKLIDGCFMAGMLSGGPVGAGLGLAVAVGLLALGVGAAVKSNLTGS